MTPLYIVETIHTQDGESIITRYPTLFFPEEALDERTIRIFADRKKPFEKYADADYVLYSLEDHQEAGQWRITRRPHLASTWIAPVSSAEQQNMTFCPVPR